MSTTRPPPSTTYLHLRPQVNKMSHIYGDRQRKNFHPHKKFQTGSTTTFSGYTNINNLYEKNKNNVQQQQQRRKYDNNDYLILSNKNKFNNKLYSNFNHVPSLMTVNGFQQPSRRNRRSIEHADQYKSRTSLFNYHMGEYYENNNIKQNKISSTSNKLNGLILSDSMCKYIRSDKVSSNGMQVSISFESGCDCSRMLNYLEKQYFDQNNIMQSEFVVFSLCTNDVANLGPDLAIQRSRFLIQRTRQLFPQIKAIGWLALSPRWKPSKLFNSSDINESNRKFNQLLQTLSKQMNFEIIYANLQHQHMHQDGLHPSIQSGRILIERALYNWFAKQNKRFSISHLDDYHPIIPSTNITTNVTIKHKPQLNHKKVNYQPINENKNYQQSNIRPINAKPIVGARNR